MSASQPANYIEWVAHLTRGQLLDLVLEVEDRLRRLIRAIFQTQGQEDWQTLIPRKIREKLAGASADGHARDLLDAATLKQLIDIVLAQWSLFQDLLKDRAKFSVKTNEFREWRNFLAHGQTP